MTGRPPLTPNLQSSQIILHVLVSKAKLYAPWKFVNFWLSVSGHIWYYEAVIKKCIKLLESTRNGIVDLMPDILQVAVRLVTSSLSNLLPYTKFSNWSGTSLDIQIISEARNSLVVQVIRTHQQGTRAAASCIQKMWEVKDGKMHASLYTLTRLISSRSTVGFHVARSLRRMSAVPGYFLSICFGALGSKIPYGVYKLRYLKEDGNPCIWHLVRFTAPRVWSPSNILEMWVGGMTQPHTQGAVNEGINSIGKKWTPDRHTSSNRRETGATKSLGANNGSAATNHQYNRSKWLARLSRSEGAHIRFPSLGYPRGRPAVVIGARSCVVASVWNWIDGHHRAWRHNLKRICQRVMKGSTRSSGHNEGPT